MSRDKTIDRLRALAMFQVIVVHVLYWGIFFTNGYINLLKSFLLFEMPLFFFVTGASNSFSKVQSYFGFVVKRFWRVLIPYWVFAVICAILSIAKFTFEGNMNLLRGIKVILSWLIPINRQMTSISYLTWALWFIPVFLCVVLIIPILKKLYASKYKVWYAFLLLTIFLITCGLKLGWVQNVAFYALWTYIGLFYSDIKAAVTLKQFRTGAVCVIGGIAVLILCCLTGSTLDMQSNKFPPNLMFLAFSVVVMGMIVASLPIVDRAMVYMEKNKLFGKIIALYSQKSMTIFLYQVFVFNITIRVTNLISYGGGIVQEMLKAIFCLLISIPSCAMAAVLLGKIENIGK